MGVITRLNGVPLFSTYREAEIYGEVHGLKGFHTHMFRDQIGFMAGINHNYAVAVKKGESIPSIVAPGSISVPPPPSDFGGLIGGSVADILPSGGGY